MTKNKASAFALVLLAMAFLFRDVIAKLVTDWSADENYSHGFLVVPLAAWIVWRERDVLRAIPIRPSWAGLLLVVASLLMLAAGLIGAELFLTRVALLGTLAGAVWFVFGFPRLRASWFPLLLLALAIPIPAIIFNQITFPLQLLASRFGEFAIASCQIPVLREGNIITLATTTLEVAEACSGIRSLVSLITLAAIWGYFTGSPSWIRWALVLSAAPIAIFANGLRVAGTGIAAHFIGPAAAQGFFHTFSGWLVFVVAGMLMLLVHRAATWLDGKRGGAPPPRTQAAAAPAIEPAPSHAHTGVFARSLGLVAFLVGTSLLLGAATRTEATGLKAPLTALPLRLGEWVGENAAPLDPEVLDTLRVDEYINRGYVAPDGRRAGLYVGYYRSQRQGQTMHSPLNCMPGSGWQPMGQQRIEVPPARPGSAAPVVNRIVVQKGLDRLLVLYWYQSHGRIVASEYWGKIYTVVDAVRLNRSDGALVRVIVPMGSADAASEAEADRTARAFVGTLLPVISRYLDQ